MENVRSAMKTRIIMLAALLAPMLFVACKSQFDAVMEGNDVNAKYAAAFDYFNQGSIW